MDGDLSTVPVEPRRDEAADDAAPASPAPASLPSTKPATPDVCILELLENAAMRFTVLDGQTIGRNHKADVPLAGVPNADYISGCHARLFRDGGQWLITHVGSTNFIKVDGEMYRGQEEVPVYDGSVVVLSLTTFRINLAG